MSRAAELLIPILTIALVVYALVKKVNIYKAFIEGAGQALPQLIEILPPLAAMLAAINVLRASGALDACVSVLTPALSKLGIDAELVPLIILRPFSGSASLAMLRDTIIKCGADSQVGREAAVIVGSTETIFYTLTVYFGAAHVTKTRHALPAALISGIIGTISGIIFARLM